ncbi:CsbD family protein [Fictibacillus phosphorivorans]|uniref:CsbD family protein n=1 Tax=Fictibacillus phosphorivorans TaxID=1221500 RepID=UPI00203BF5F5|nr:CsbD family protein [Fictibacillus phosphorivorans]MCM3718234.1 CsbD family protein [Fictibacillus phosphorivorans]MCM3775899.1 CsbD family protein [Fictibacillus phosphorivorans]
MKHDTMEGKWKQLKGEAKKQWGNLTDDDYDQAQGDREKMIGKIQERHGKTREDAEREYDEWNRRFSGY